MHHSLWSLIPIGGVVAALSLPASAPARSTEQAVAPVIERNQAKLDALLARFDAMKPGAERDALEREIDKVAGQRYATVSRLYWHTDLAAAKAAAAKTTRPILALRMLGRLDEDLSCANSRLFRATLYANARVSKFLRDNFILYWSTERPVPRVTIDFGDGRKIESTTTGNSAHYVLDAEGNVLDVLPGLYAPVAFERELAGSLALARSARGVAADERAQLIVAYQDRLRKQGQDLQGVPYIAGRRRLLGQADVTGAIALAQRATMAKAFIEVPALRWTGHDAGELPDVAKWASLGQVLYGIGDLQRGKIDPYADDAPQVWEPTTKPVLPKVLDDQSRALIARLHTAGGMTAKPEEIAAVIERLEQLVVADSAQNQLQLRKQIAHEMVQQARSMTLDSLNTWIYANVFHTPREDAWLGLLPRTTFTGLPGDGVVR